MWTSHSRFGGPNQCTILHPHVDPRVLHQDIMKRGIYTEPQVREELLFER